MHSGRGNKTVTWREIQEEGGNDDNDDGGVGAALKIEELSDLFQHTCNLWIEDFKVNMSKERLQQHGIISGEINSGSGSGSGSSDQKNPLKKIDPLDDFAQRLQNDILNTEKELVSLREMRQKMEMETRSAQNNNNNNNTNQTRKTSSKQHSRSRSRTDAILKRDSEAEVKDMISKNLLMINTKLKVENGELKQENERLREDLEKSEERYKLHDLMNQQLVTVNTKLKSQNDKLREEGGLGLGLGLGLGSGSGSSSSANTSPSPSPQLSLRIPNLELIHENQRLRDLTENLRNDVETMRAEDVRRSGEHYQLVETINLLRSENEKLKNDDTYKTENESLKEQNTKLREEFSRLQASEKELFRIREENKKLRWERPKSPVPTEGGEIAKLRTDAAKLKEEATMLRQNIEKKEATLLEITNYAKKLKTGGSESTEPENSSSSTPPHPPTPPPSLQEIGNTLEIIASGKKLAPVARPKAIRSNSFTSSERGFSIEKAKEVQQLLRESNTDEEVTKYLKEKQNKGETEAREWIESVLGYVLVGGENLMEILKTGTVLCKLINTIKPGTIRKVHDPPTSPFKEMENIQAFLTACDQLGVRKSEIFDAVALHQNKNPFNVISTLHAVAKLSQSMKPSNAPFVHSPKPSPEKVRRPPTVT